MEILLLKWLTLVSVMFSVFSSRSWSEYSLRYSSSKYSGHGVCNIMGNAKNNDKAGNKKTVTNDVNGRLVDES